MTVKRLTNEEDKKDVENIRGTTSDARAMVRF
jgi:hypothetical protein